MPAFTFCNKTGFKNLNLNSKLSDYLESTTNSTDLIENTGQYFLDEFHIRGENVDDQLDTMYSMYRGQCHTFTFSEKVGT